MARKGMAWEPWEIPVALADRPEEAARRLMRSPNEIYRRAWERRARTCYRCPHWNGTCGVEEAGLHLAKERPLKLTRYPVVHQCHMGLD